MDGVNAAIAVFDGARRGADGAQDYARIDDLELLSHGMIDIYGISGIHIVTMLSSYVL